MEIQAQELHPPRNRENLCMLFFAVLNDFQVFIDCLYFLCCELPAMSLMYLLIFC